MVRHIHLFVMIVLMALCPSAFSSDRLAPGDPWPLFSLPAPEDKIQRYYLGLGGQSSFSLADIKSEFVLVQIFSMYCPICQREAPRVNQLFDAVDGRDELRRRFKVIGIGAGNSGFEVDFYRRNYGVQFPLFSDGEYEIHQLLGEVGTPHFFLVQIRDDGSPRIVFIKAGGFKSARAFLKKLLHISGLDQ